MKKTIILLAAFLLLFGLTQAETWWIEEDKPLAVQSNIACDSIWVTVYDSGTVMHEVKSLKYTSANLISGSQYLYTDSAYTFPSDGWIGAYHISYNLYADGVLKGSAIEVFSGAWYDSMKASGYAEAGDAMILTAGERSAIEDSIYANKNDYKTSTAGLSTFNPASDTVIWVDSLITPTSLIASERASIADSVWNTAEATLLLLFNSADSVKSYSPDSTIFYYSSSTGKKTYTVGNGKVTKWERE